MEKTAAGVPLQDPKQFCQPPSFCMSEMVLALGLLELVGVGDALGEGLGEATAFDADTTWPPHPATVAQVAKLKTTRLGRSRFFNFSIWGTLSERLDLTGDVLCSL
jgi:hypothetical protein